LRPKTVKSTKAMLGKLGAGGKDIGIYSFVNITIELQKQLTADALGTLSCKQINFKERVRKVVNKVK
jgi:N-acetylglucosamine-6-phosphate deacetylase